MIQMIGPIQTLLRNHRSKVKASSGWLALHQELCIGVRVKGYIHFADTDLDRLREELDRMTNGRSLGFDLHANRIDMARQLSDEKQSNVSVFGELIQVARLGEKPIRLKNKDLFTPVGAVLSIKPALIDYHGIDAIVFVENGAVMANWWEMLLPPECECALIVYRGHKNNVKYALDLIVNAPPNVQVFGYFDFDPAGVEMAMQLSYQRSIEILLPANWEAVKPGDEFYDAANKRTSFVDQQDALRRLLEADNEGVKMLAQHLSRHRVAVTQEHLIAHSIPIASFKF